MRFSCLSNPSVSLALDALHPRLQNVTDWAKANELSPNLLDHCSCPSITRVPYKAPSTDLLHVLQLACKTEAFPVRQIVSIAARPATHLVLSPTSEVGNNVVAGCVLISAAKVINVTDPLSMPYIRYRRSGVSANFWHTNSTQIGISLLKEPSAQDGTKPADAVEWLQRLSLW